MKTRSQRVVSLVAAAFISVLATTASYAQLWNFTSDAQGWQLYDAVGSGNYSFVANYPVTWNAAGGNPGGYISGLDPSSGSFFFQAPGSNGNFSSFAGGQLKFSLLTNQSADYSDDSVVVFRSVTSNITIVTSLLAQPGAAWTPYSLSLTPGAFRYNNLAGGVVNAADFATVLGDLDVFLIAGEFHNGVSETSGLDSVEFVRANAGGGAVPEPSTYGLAGAAVLLGFAALRRRMRVAA